MWGAKCKTNLSRCLIQHRKVLYHHTTALSEDEHFCHLKKRDWRFFMK